jgi:hypothetical protein
MPPKQPFWPGLSSPDSYDRVEIAMAGWSFTIEDVALSYPDTTFRRLQWLRCDHIDHINDPG